MRGVVLRLREVRRWAPSQQVLRLVVLLAPLVALLAAWPAGNAPSPWVVVVALLLSSLWAAAPESGAGTVVLVVVLLWWTRVPGDALHPAVLVAAAALLVAHLAALVGAAAPPRTPVDPAVLRLWVLRGSGLLLAAPVLWVLARALRDEAAPGGLWPAALAAALLLVVVLTLALQRREEA